MSHFPKYAEYVLQVALKFDLIYAHLGYFYTAIPNVPSPSVDNASGASRAMDGIVGTISHPQPYTPPPMSYGQPQGGTSSSYIYPSPIPPHDNSYPSPNMP